MFRDKGQGKTRRGMDGLCLQDDDGGFWGLRYNNFTQGRGAPGVSVVTSDSRMKVRQGKAR